MYPTTEADDPKSQGSRGAGARRAMVMVFPSSVALELPRHMDATGRAWLDEAGFDDPKVSKHHLRFHTQGGTVSVEDLGSRNGTFVDGEQLAPGDVCTLLNRAVIRVGHTLFVYRDDFTGPATPDPPFGALVSPFGLRRVRADIDRIMSSVGQDAGRILILGETGTGKDLVAREIALRLRARQPELVNVTAIEQNLFDSELFGHARGAFSGAHTESPGRLKRNAGGSVVLDEIGDLPLGSQPKLLRFMQDGEIQPLGKRPERVDVLLLAATNRLDALSDSAQFRADLLARFRDRLTLPPLRERPEDVFRIATALAERLTGQPYVVDSVAAKAVERLLLRPWDHFNTRELEQCVRFAASRVAPPALTERAVGDALVTLGAPLRTYPLTSLTRARALAAVEAAGGNESHAAEQLGVSRAQLRRKLEK